MTGDGRDRAWHRLNGAGYSSKPPEVASQVIYCSLALPISGPMDRSLIVKLDPVCLLSPLAPKDQRCYPIPKAFSAAASGSE